MMTNRSRMIAGALSIAAAFLSFPAASSADDGQGSSASQDGYASSLPDGTVDCFDYYKFQSVQVDVSANLSKALPGTTLGFEGEIRNGNGYPVVGGSVYVKVFRVQADGSVAHAQGHDLVDQFFAKEGISLKAGESQPVAFSWKVPAGAESGDYEIDTYFQSDRKFNLLGLSFTDDVAGNKSAFSVGGSASPARLSKEGVTVNGKDFNFAAFPPHVGKDEDSSVKFLLSNPSKEARTVYLSYELYSWDGLREENLKDSRSETVSLKPDETKELQYATDKNGFPVSYLVVEAKDGDAKSILDIRWVHDGTDLVRLNFPAMLTYPLEKGKEASLFSCLHDSGTSDVDNGRLVLTVSSQGKELYRKEYAGKVTSDMMAVKGDFVPKDSYSDFDLRADLYQDGKLVDSSAMHYGCAELGQACPEAGGAGLLPGLGNGWKGTAVLAAALASLVLALLAAFLVRRRRGRGLRVLAFLAIAGGSLLLSSGTARAEKSTVWSLDSGTIWNGGNWRAFYTYVGSYSCHGDNGVCGYNTAKAYVRNLHAGVTYRAKAVDVDSGNEIASGSNVLVGSRIRFERITSADTDASWCFTSSWSDSPYGYWVDGAAPVISDYCGRQVLGSDFDFGSCTVASFNPPAVSLGNQQGLSCGSDNVCTVVGSGEVGASVDFGATYGKFYGTHATVNYGGYVSGSAADELLSFGIPAQSVPFSFVAVNPNGVPSVPAISGPVRVLAGSSNAYSFLSTDPEGDSLRYQADWDGDGTADELSPATGWVASGTSSSSSHAWPSAGNYSFRARACDDRGTDHCSAWSAPYAVEAYVPVKGECGQAVSSVRSSAPSSDLCSRGSASSVSGSGPWSWTCSGTDGGSDASCTACKAASYSCDAGGSCASGECGMVTKASACMRDDGCGHASAVPAGECSSHGVSCAASKVVDCGVCNGGQWTEK